MGTATPSGRARGGGTHWPTVGGGKATASGTTRAIAVGAAALVAGHTIPTSGVATVAGWMAQQSICGYQTPGPCFAWPSRYQSRATTSSQEPWANHAAATASAMTHRETWVLVRGLDTNTACGVCAVLASTMTLS